MLCALLLPEVLKLRKAVKGVFLPPGSKSKKVLCQIHLAGHRTKNVNSGTAFPCVWYRTRFIFIAAHLSEQRWLPSDYTVAQLTLQEKRNGFHKAAFINFQICRTHGSSGVVSGGS
ncbi:hypothetical protein R1flu_016552 [Riccia fluitans]|uniref:Secreted protein n=1 Tax=Riccia fluitans TaxID=41844 RepID=A0ABD1YMP3_9MARC